MDWEAWGRTVEAALGSGGDGSFQDLFAPGGVFEDPVNAPTTDLAAVEAMTEASFPDWGQEVTSVRGDEHGGVFEWIGRGTMGGTHPIELHGCTVVDVDDAGRVVRWRDYFDLKEIEAQLPT